MRTAWTGLKSGVSSPCRPASGCAPSSRFWLPFLEFAVASVEPKIHEILVRLADEGVEVIVVGMAAAVLQGVPVTTWDLDVVHRRTPENVTRLLGVLRDLEAVARHDLRRLEPDATHLSGPGHVLMETRFGDFGCLGAIDGGRSYEDLLGASLVVDFEGRPLRMLSLRELLAIKTRAGRPKDIAAIPYIQSTIDEIERES
jgi:hypothetical protein